MPRANLQKFDSLLLLALFFLIVWILHFPLLRLPYFWDEAGYYVPAARDLLLNGSPIPRLTVSNAHPPLLMAYLAMWWKVAGFSPLVTRTAMLLVAAFSLLGVYRLAQRVANAKVAAASVLCTAAYPVFFAQSSLAHLDLAAAGLTFWALSAYVKERMFSAAIWFSFAVLAKETAILAPVALVAWEVLRLAVERKTLGPKILWLLLPIVPLGAWYGFHYARTGFVFGNAEFFRYNVQATVHPLRILLALLMRLWQCFGYLNLYLLTAAGLLAMWRRPISENGKERPRIALNSQFAFLSVMAAYVIAMAIVGGAVLARYMLPVVPLGIIVLVSTLWRRVALWRWVLAIVAVGFTIGLFVNPPYGFAPEDNLAYRDYIQLHQNAERFLEARYPMSRVLTAWPANDELTRPFLGYVSRPMRVVRIEDFRLEQVLSAEDARSQFDVAFVFSAKYEPSRPLLEHWQNWEKIKARFFDYHRDIPPAVAAQVLDGEIVYNETRNGQWAAVIELHRVLDAQLRIK